MPLLALIKAPLVLNCYNCTANTKPVAHYSTKEIIYFAQIYTSQATTAPKNASNCTVPQSSVTGRVLAGKQLRSIYNFSQVKQYKVQ